MRIFAIIWILLTTVSCVKTLDVTTDVNQVNRYYAFAFFNPDSTGKLMLGRMNGITEPYAFIDTAKAEVSNLTRIESNNMLSVGEGNYRSGRMGFSSGDTLQLQVEWNKNLILIKDKVPEGIEINDVKSYPYTANYVGRTTAFTLSFKDSAYAENHYRIWIQEAYWKYKRNNQDEIIDSSWVLSTMPISGTELPFIRNEYNVYTNRELLCTDETFNGLETSFVVFRNAPEEKDIRRVYFDVFIENLSPSLYHYYNDRNAHLWQQTSITQLPTEVEGNLGNVYGVMGIFRASRFRINL